MFLKAALKENEMATLCFLIEKALYVLKYFLSLDSRLIYSAKVYEVLMKKAKITESESLRNLLLNQTFEFASGDEQLQEL